MFEKPNVIVWDDDVFKLTVWNAVKNGHRIGMQRSAYARIRDEAIGSIIKGQSPKFYSIYALSGCYWKAATLHPTRVVSIELLTFLCDCVSPLIGDRTLSALRAAWLLDGEMRFAGRNHVLELVDAPGMQKLVASSFCTDRLGLGFEIPLLNKDARDPLGRPRVWNKAHPL